MTDGNAGRRQFLRAVGVAGVAAVAGCTSSGSEATSTRTTTETATTATTTERKTTQSTTEQTTSTTDRVTVEDVRERRASLMEAEKGMRYESGIPSVGDYDLDFDRVQSENETRREQLIDITETVGDQYNDWVEGNHAVMNAINNLDWMNWGQDNIVNIVTRYNSQTMEQITANYSTEDGGRNLDGTIASDSISGEETYIEDIPDSELMDGNGVNLLVTDTEAWKDSLEENNWSTDDYRALRLNALSVIPGVKGPSTHAERDTQDIGLVLDDEAIAYIGENYDDSAASVNEVSKAMLEIELATKPVRNEGRYVGVTVGSGGLEVAAIYSEEEGKARLQEPIKL